jgi:hypothetical protein
VPSIVDPIRRLVPLVMVPSLVPSASVWRAAMLSLPDIGVAVFFIAGSLAPIVGTAAPWYVLAAVALAAACRTLDIEGWGVPIRGGLCGRAAAAFGPRGAGVAASAQLLERVLFASLMALVFGRYLAALPVWLFVPIAAGLVLGGILGSIGFLRIAIWSAFSTLYGPHWLPSRSITTTPTIIRRVIRR